MKSSIFKEFFNKDVISEIKSNSVSLPEIWSIYYYFHQQRSSFEKNKAVDIFIEFSYIFDDFKNKQ